MEISINKTNLSTDGEDYGNPKNFENFIAQNTEDLFLFQLQQVIFLYYDEINVEFGKVLNYCFRFINLMQTNRNL